MTFITPKKFSVPIQLEDVAQSWGQRGYSCDLFIDPPGREWNNFVHSTHELVTVVVGKLRMTINVTAKRSSLNRETRCSFLKEPVIP